jgi:hypothetical protein
MERIKAKMAKTFSNHRGSLIEGDGVTIIKSTDTHYNILDPFDIEWVVPFEFIHTY